MVLRTVVIVLFDDVQSLDVTGPLEVFTGATRWLGAQAGGESVGPTGGYRVITASLGAAPIRSTSGLVIQPEADLRALRAADILLVPGGEGSRADSPELVAWIAQAAPRSGRVVSVCTGAFLLAEAGVLDGRRATTHWANCAALAVRYPAVTVDPEPIFVRDGNVATSAGVTAGIDLALALVEEDLGRDAALTIARHLVMFLRRPGNQAQFSVQLSARAAERGGLRDIQRWVAVHPADDLSVEALARRARLSPRHFARAFRAEIGVTPGRYVDQTRLENARRLLEDTADAVGQVARASGYGTSEAMRRAFVRDLGIPPAEYRRRF